MGHVAPFVADMPGAIVLPAQQYGYNGKPGLLNKPVAIGLHTPEEPADATASTPRYFHNLYNREASTHYFLAKVLHYNALTGEWTRWYQMVPEKAGAYGNVLQGKPRPAWSDPNGALGGHLNLQTISIEIEGFARNIHLTMPATGPMWADLVAGMADIARRNPGIKLANTFGHYQVSTLRSDPGVLNIARVIREAEAILAGPAPAEEDDMTDEELRTAIREETWGVVLELLRLGTTGDKKKPMKQYSDKVLSELKDIKAKLDAPGHH